ncbi:hypothetical protein DPEC_G00304420 [Dallia pectoralis]|uniref:Uncharacterized protein n=1 Tax=Dallia pectoralis TaxID=75939 RepID=A0ACC2FDL3_DALPE|nr:hypothetical protein DPEC_G00304420 [Dallia pectoralis]
MRLKRPCDVCTERKPYDSSDQECSEPRVTKPHFSHLLANPFRVSVGFQEPQRRWERLMSLSMFLCVPQTAVQRKRWRAPCKLMCPLSPCGFHFTMQPDGPRSSLQ